MNGNISIRPSKDIRTNYAQISELAQKNPVAITVNGREDTVLLSHKSFLEQQQLITDLQAKLQVYAHLAQSQDDIKLGRIQPAENVMDDMIKDVENLDI